MKEKILKNFDVTVVVTIGLATILTAFVTFTGSLWGSTSVSMYSKAIVELNDANTSYLEHIQGGLTEEEQKEVEKEFQNGWNNSEEKLLKADEANSNNDKFLLMTVLLAISIFFGSTSLSMKKENLKITFFFFSATIFLISLIWVVTLPMPF